MRKCQWTLAGYRQQCDHTWSSVCTAVQGKHLRRKGFIDLMGHVLIVGLWSCSRCPSSVILKQHHNWPFEESTPPLGCHSTYGRLTVRRIVVGSSRCVPRPTLRDQRNSQEYVIANLSESCVFSRNCLTLAERPNFRYQCRLTGH